MEDDNQQCTSPNNEEEYSKSSKGGGKIRGRPKGSRNRSSHEIHVPVDLKRPSRTLHKVQRYNNVAEKKWTVVEKTKLLEGIRRFSEDNIDILSNIIQTRTPDEVTEYMDYLKQHRPGKVFKNKNEDEAPENTDNKSPVEQWAELVAEMTYYEDKNFSDYIPKVFGLIARNESFAPSQIPRLNWRNIYKFISDLLHDKIDLQELTNVECHVVLDMIQQLGDTLHTSDKDVHSKLLTAKYELLNTKLTDNSEEDRNRRQAAVHKALSNDFNFLGGSTEPQTSSVSSDDQELPVPSGDDNSSTTEGKTSSVTEKKSSPGNVQKKFIKPKLYTLNPLCIPPPMLTLKPKSQSE